MYVLENQRGRGQEVPGEDPTLTSEYVKHYSNGLQHGDTPGDDEEPYLQILSTCKHFFGYDIEYHRMKNDLNISTRFLVEYYLPAFKACIQDAKVKSVRMLFLETRGHCWDLKSLAPSSRGLPSTFQCMLTCASSVTSYIEGHVQVSAYTPTTMPRSDRCVC